MQRIPYIVSSNPQGISEVLKQTGIRPSKQPKKLLFQTKKMIREEGKEGVKALLEAHPDKDLLLNLFGANLQEECPHCGYDSFTADDNYCSYCGSDGYDDFDEEEKKDSEETKNRTDTGNIVSGLEVAGIAFISLIIGIVITSEIIKAAKS